MMEGVAINEPGDGRTYTAMVGDWVTAARTSDGFVGGGALVVGMATLLVALGLHGSSYDNKGVPTVIAYLGGLAVQLVVVALLTAVLTLYPSAKTTGWWRTLLIVASVLTLFFAVLPAMVAGYSPIAALLFAVLTILYDLAAATYLAVVSPWSRVR